MRGSGGLYPKWGGMFGHKNGRFKRPFLTVFQRKLTRLFLNCHRLAGL